MEAIRSFQPRRHNPQSNTCRFAYQTDFLFTQDIFWVHRASHALRTGLKWLERKYRLYVHLVPRLKVHEDLSQSPLGAA